MLSIVTLGNNVIASPAKPDVAIPWGYGNSFGVALLITEINMENQLLSQNSYPISYRKNDVQEIVKHLASFQPVTIVGLPRVGLARILRFILVHPKLLEEKIKSPKLLLIEIDINDLFEMKEKNFWQLILKRISDNTNSKEIHHLYNSSTKTNDEFTFFDNTKIAINQLCANGYFVFLFFNRFDRALTLFSYLFFAHLQSLKDVAKARINFLFTSNRPLEYLSPDIFKGGNLEVFSQKYFLKPSSKNDLIPVVSEFEKSRIMVLNNKVKDIVYQYSGGHSQYALLILQILEKNKFNTENIDSFLKKDISIFEQGKEIWDYLTLDEKSRIITTNKISPNDILLQIGLITPDGNIFSPLFEHFISIQSAVEKESQKELTKKEKLLLSLLTGRKGELVTREEIINFVWPSDPEEVNNWTVDQLIKRLRKKLSVLKENKKIITIKNQGYKLT